MLALDMKQYELEFLQPTLNSASASGNYWYVTLPVDALTGLAQLPFFKGCDDKRSGLISSGISTGRSSLFGPVKV